MQRNGHFKVYLGNEIDVAHLADSLTLCAWCIHVARCVLCVCLNHPLSG